MSKSNDKFPFNLDEVGKFAHFFKEKAVGILKKEFIQVFDDDSFAFLDQRLKYDYKVIEEKILAGHT